MRSVAVLGYSNTGKTTFIEVFTALAQDAGLSTAVVKYSRHPGDFDRPGSDTHRFGGTPAQFVAYSGRDRWFLSVPGDTVTNDRDHAGDRDRDRRAGFPAPSDDRTVDDEFARIPPWLRPLVDSIDILILEGRRLPDSLVCLTTGNVTAPEELKYPLDLADVVITASPLISKATQRPARSENAQTRPRFTADETAAARVMIDILQRKGATT